VHSSFQRDERLFKYPPVAEATIGVITRKETVRRMLNQKARLLPFADTISNWWLMYAEYVDIKEMPTAKSKE